MNADSTERRVRRVSAARVLGSAGVVTATAAVAGIGTLGTSTGSTAPAPVSIESGVVSIPLAAADGRATVPLAFAGVVRTVWRPARSSGTAR